MQTVGPGSMARKLKILENANTHFRAWNMAENTEKLGKWEMHTVGTEIWQEN